MLRDEDAGPAEGESHSRQGFYAWIDRHYERMLQWSMAHRMAVMLFAGLVMLSSIPLYTLVQQEYIPSNVDEAEFEVSVTAPQGTSLAAIDAIMQAVESELRAIPLVRLMLCDAGGGFIAARTGGCMCASPPRRASFSFTALARDPYGQPWVALRNLPSATDTAGPRGLKITDLRTPCALPSSTRRRQLGHRFRPARSNLQTLSPMSKNCASVRQNSLSSMPYTLKLGIRNCAWHRCNRGRRPNVTRITRLSLR